jgi:hypothetical protein
MFLYFSTTPEAEPIDEKAHKRKKHKHEWEESRFVLIYFFNQFPFSICSTVNEPELEAETSTHKKKKKHKREREETEFEYLIIWMNF